jgi:NADH:ubiquinone oxidoreductase subunit C
MTAEQIKQLADEIKAALEGGLGAKILELTNPAPRRMFMTVAPADLVEALKTCKDQAGLYHLSTITGRDTGDKLEALYHLSREGMTFTVRCRTERASPSLPTVASVYPGATMYEREVHDILGIVIEGNPDQRTLVLPEGWPQGVFPLRKDWQYNREKGAIE